MATDRQIFKERQVGQAQSFGLAASPEAGVVADMHRRSIVATKDGTENAVTNVAERGIGVVNRKSRVVTIKWCGAAVTQNTVHYAKLNVYKRTSAGATQVLLGSWNTHNSAQGTITALAASSLSCSSNSDIVIDAGATLTYELKKYGANGVAVGFGSITVDLEEV